MTFFFGPRNKPRVRPELEPKQTCSRTICACDRLSKLFEPSVHVKDYTVEDPKRITSTRHGLTIGELLRGKRERFKNKKANNPFPEKGKTCKNTNTRKRTKKAINTKTRTIHFPKNAKKANNRNHLKRQKKDNKTNNPFLEKGSKVQSLAKVPPKNPRRFERSVNKELRTIAGCFGP